MVTVIKDLIVEPEWIVVYRPLQLDQVQVQPEIEYFRTLLEEGDQASIVAEIRRRFLVLPINDQLRLKTNLKLIDRRPNRHINKQAHIQTSTDLLGIGKYSPYFQKGIVDAIVNLAHEDVKGFKNAMRLFRLVNYSDFGDERELVIALFEAIMLSALEL